MNTGFLGPAVATVLTACGIETRQHNPLHHGIDLLQQYLPLAVLKLSMYSKNYNGHKGCNSTYRLRY